MTGEERRSQIIDVAERLFSKQGYEQTTLDDLAAEIGFTKPAIYYYFDSKDTILFEIHDRIVRKALEGLERIEANHDSATDRLMAALLAHGEAVLANVDANRVFERDRHALSAPRRSAIQERDRQYTRILRNWHTQAVDEGRLRAADSTIAIGSALGAINWAYRLPAAATLDARDAAAQLLDAAAHGLGVQPS